MGCSIQITVPGSSCLKWKELSDCSFLAPWCVMRNREVTDIQASVSLRWKQASQLHTAWKWKWIGRVRLFVTPWTIQSVEFSRPEYLSSHSLLQGIFPTQGSNPGLLHCRQILYQLSHEGILRILEWVAYSFFSGSSQPRNWTGVTCIAGGFLTNWTIREANIQHESGLFKVDGYYIWTIWKFWRDDKMTMIIKAVKPFLQYSSNVCWKPEFK